MNGKWFKYSCTEFFLTIILESLINQHLFFYPHLKTFFSLLLECGREREKHRCKREASIGCLPHAPGPKTGPTTEACAFWLQGDAPSTHLNHTDQGKPISWRVKIQLLTYVMILPSNIWSTRPKVTFVWMHRKRCFGNSDNKLVWIPPQILAQCPEKRTICKILGMAWLSIKITAQ